MTLQGNCVSEKKNPQPPQQGDSMLLAAFTTHPQLKNSNMNRKVEYQSAKVDRTIEAMEKQAFVAYITKVTLQYDRFFFRRDLHF